MSGVTYKSILADLKAGGMSHRDAQAQASKDWAKYKEDNAPAEESGDSKEEKESTPGAGETKKPEPKEPIVTGLTVDKKVLKNCMKKIDEAIEACENAAIDMKDIAGKGGRFARAATKMRQIRKFHIK